MNKVLLSFLGSIILFAVLPSCQKDKTCKASVFIIDENGSPVAEAKVLLFSDVISPVSGPSLINEERTTDKNGRVEFEQELPKILFIKVEKSGLSQVTGEIETIKFEQSKRSFVTIEMKH